MNMLEGLVRSARYQFFAIVIYVCWAAVSCFHLIWMIVCSYCCAVQDCWHRLRSLRMSLRWRSVLHEQEGRSFPNTSECASSCTSFEAENQCEQAMQQVFTLQVRRSNLKGKKGKLFRTSAREPVTLILWRYCTPLEYTLHR